MAVKNGAKRLGDAGEQLAADYLIKNGLSLIARNYRVRGGEIDIIAKEGDCVVFAEVKTRAAERFAAPREAVGGKKRKRLQLAAENWLAETGYGGFCRFDVIEVIAGDRPLIRHWRDAF